jgi:hypothetical protein
VKTGPQKSQALTVVASRHGGGGGGHAEAASCSQGFLFWWERAGWMMRILLSCCRFLMGNDCNAEKGSSTVHAGRISFRDAGRLKGGEKEFQARGDLMKCCYVRFTPV